MINEAYWIGVRVKRYGKSKKVIQRYMLFNVEYAKKPEPTAENPNAFRHMLNRRQVIQAYGTLELFGEGLVRLGFKGELYEYTEIQRMHRGFLTRKQLQEGFKHE